ncbi:MAG: OadG family protein [Methylococcaceae bacterium]|nr:OadG family protein [Methylococcaceae bacterium]
MDSSISELVFSGLKLMLIGMGIVFMFLALLVWVIGVSSKLIGYLEEREQERESKKRDRKGTSGTSREPGGDRPQAIDAELIAAITAAIHQHQTK